MLGSKWLPESVMTQKVWLFPDLWQVINSNMYSQFLSFLHANMTQVVEILPHVPTLHSPYHGCWWPGDARSQGISSHNVDPVKLG